MKRTGSARRGAVPQITLGRAARLHRLVRLLANGGRTRDDLLVNLKIGLRTFYRELDRLRRCGVKVRFAERRYTLNLSAEEAEGRLPFPDPQLSFAEMAELARCPGPAAQRLAGLLQSVLSPPEPRAKRSRKVKA